MSGQVDTKPSCPVAEWIGFLKGGVCLGVRGGKEGGGGGPVCGFERGW